jgi:chromosome segregation ATPase
LPPSDPLAPLYYLIGSMVVLQLGAMIFGAIKWLAGRTVEREDRDKEDLRSRLADHDDRFGKLDRTLSDLERLLGQLSAAGATNHTSVEAIRGAVAEIKVQVENRFDKQAEFYRSQLKETVVQVTEKLEKLEFDIRQDTTRAIHDAAAMRARTKKG